ncbi:myotubularin-related protein 14-like isoform X2 [Hydractinia symbiolongicarpus]|uniref:myotubularin-related protein 14-like isoform X2 n=1 Tax=Hydractinia symbiolongicarpus TaxID=13093 RepID=UPI002550F874|nr:myotubularin-related protein 14-like isoform X2 [Hydractinia symbiolongicarpus]
MLGGKEDASCIVDLQAISSLISHFSKHSYKADATSSMVSQVEDTCLQIFQKGYQCNILYNNGGNHCSHYPTKIIISAGEKSFERHKEISLGNLNDLISKSKKARCRSRFVIPVLWIKEKCICRSSTLASAAELYGRSGYDYLFSGGKNVAVNKEPSARTQDGAIVDKVRGYDIQLLKELSVKYILDLMLERKKVKYGLNITSSEKVDKENRYGDFEIASSPYPGCEIFQNFKNNGYCGEGVCFDWSQDFADAFLSIPTSVPLPVNIEWKNYKLWDLVTLTQNYLRLILSIIGEGKGNLLIHCISGWDRTPLFISLIRMSLWADDKIHQSLSAEEILYLTIAYDWFLFGHNLQDRLVKGEEIFYFCFDYLKYIVSEEFVLKSERFNTQQCRNKDESLLSKIDGISLESSCGNASHDFFSCNDDACTSSMSPHTTSNKHGIQQSRTTKLATVRSLFLTVYAAEIGHDTSQNTNTGLAGILDGITSKMIKAARVAYI